jgi:hypothetical protein
MLFEENLEVSKIWEMMKKDKELVRGKHDILKNLFVDKDAPYFAVVSDGKHVVTRNVHETSKGVKVVFYIYSRISYYQAETKYIKAMLDKVNE